MDNPLDSAFCVLCVYMWQLESGGGGTRRKTKKKNQCLLVLAKKSENPNGGSEKWMIFSMRKSVNTSNWKYTMGA